MTMLERPLSRDGFASFRPVDISASANPVPRFDEMRAAVADQIASLVADPRVASARRVFLTGSGDGFIAALSTQGALARWSGLPVQALSAMAFARYEAPVAGPGELLVGISGAGTASRPREAVAFAKAAQIPTLAVTATPTSPLAREADLVLHRTAANGGEAAAPPDELQPVTEHLATLYALYAFGLELGAARGRLTPRARDMWHERLANSIEQVAPTLAGIAPKARRMASAIAGLDTVWFLGTGPSGGSARYGAALFQRCLGINGVAEDLEEWAHQQYFLTRSWGGRAVTIVLAPPGNALDRAQEIVTGIKAAGGRAAVVTAPGIDGFEDAEFRFDVPDVGTEWLSPMLYCLPAHLLAFHLGRRTGGGAAVPKTPDWLTRQAFAKTGLDWLV